MVAVSVIVNILVGVSILFTLLKKLGGFSDLPDTVKRLEKKLDKQTDDIRRWQHDHILKEHRSRW